MRRLLVILALLGLLTACAQAADPAAGPLPGDPGPADGDTAVSSDLVQPVGGDLRVGEPWYLVGGMLEAPVTGQATLTFTNQDLLGEGPLNGYSTTYEASDDGALELGEWGVTLVGGPDAAMALERELLDLLGEVDGFTTVTGGELYLFDGDLNVLVYATTPPSDEPTITDETQAVALEIVGMRQARAKVVVEDAGLTFRVVSRDGTALAITEDYSVTRINASVVDGRVTETWIG
jgi:heat shock protein HslJ